MPKRSVYIRPADEPVWERAAALAASDGLSRFLTAAIRLYLERNDPMSTTNELHRHEAHLPSGQVMLSHSHPNGSVGHLHDDEAKPLRFAPNLSGLSPTSADAILDRCAKAVAVAGLDDAAHIVEHARPETAARLRALAAEVWAWE